MKSYELLDHTADAKFRAYGMNIEETFANAVKGMTAIITDPDKLSEDRTFNVEVSADDDKKLLYDFLDRIIFLMDTEGFIPARAEVTIENGTLTATLHGDNIKTYGGNIKAVTYSDMEVSPTMIQVVVDI